MTLASGTALGPYQIEAPLGAGGMGEVYRARDTRLDRIVAIKVLPENVAADLELKQRFEYEARVVASLSHPHICTLFDVGEHEGRPFIAMELLEGQVLSERISSQGVRIEQVVEWGLQVPKHWRRPMPRRSSIETSSQGTSSSRLGAVPKCWTLASPNPAHWKVDRARRAVTTRPRWNHP